MTLTPSKLIEFGMALYGDQWEATMGRRLKVSVRTIERWRDEQTAMPPGLYAILDGLVEQQLAQIDRLRDYRQSA